ncbi:TIGR03619 family F420-dependent LLM class oxidoreductase [Mycobacterium colombiense]|uniref:TIGR03619 family F420-dependent LLM class oxidoreductase n=1 Tax=Mycobacterium colombiense TaxID=339268 RepID=UPI00021B1C85|nr:TIGR03619 family F420-dependent LLM class oxidoreductase [Mycobacterium colombiense]
MKFHVMLPGCVDTPAVTQPWESQLTGADVLRIAQAADECGFESVFIPEHFVVNTAHTETTGRHFLDSTTAQAVIAGATKRIKVGSMVTLVPLRNPIILAKSLCTLDWLTGGRAAMTVGLGWQRDEYDALGVPWEERGARTDDYLAAMFELWHSDFPQFDGKYTSFSDIVFEPKPVSKPHPTIWIGGDATPALRRAARFGDGWAPWLTPPDQIPEKIDRIRSSPEFNDRPFSVFYSLMSLLIGLGESGHENRAINGFDAATDAQRVVDSCERLAELGVTDTWVPPPRVDGVGEYIDHLRWVADEVATQFTHVAT